MLALTRPRALVAFFRQFSHYRFAVPSSAPSGHKAGVRGRFFSRWEKVNTRQGTVSQRSRQVNLTTRHSHEDAVFNSRVAGYRSCSGFLSVTSTSTSKAKSDSRLRGNDELKPSHRALEKPMNQAPPPPASPARVVYCVPQKSPGVAALLEILPGVFVQTFGIGHIYAGNVATGLIFMFGYWVVAAINALLCMVFIGFITWPLCWIATAIISTLMAANSVKKANLPPR
jgi:TM2 domain-containing membrane protein YozV